MQNPFLRPRGYFSLLLLAFLAAPADAQPEKIKFDTVDGVQIRGNFFAGKRNAPVVMILHDYENQSSTKEWTNLAESLQKAGYSVLAFDFRGHGLSTEISDAPTFWNYKPNAYGMKNAKAVQARGTLEFKDFKPEYRNSLVNDIAAAKAYLDRRNDTGACNSAATILIGAEDGATLGAIWLNSETHRFKLVPNMFGMPVAYKDPEAKDVTACLWLTISPKLGSHTFSIEKTLYRSGRLQEIPMLFLYGGDDKPAMTRAKGLEKYLKDAKLKAGSKFTKSIGVPGTTLAGSALLKASGADKAIIEWLDEVVLARAPEWLEKNFLKNQYIWIPTGGGIIPARTHPTEMNMYYESYLKYMPR